MTWRVGRGMARQTGRPASRRTSLNKLAAAIERIINPPQANVVALREDDRRPRNGNRARRDEAAPGDGRSHR
jgi:hypothetical protein